NTSQSTVGERNRRSKGTGWRNRRLPSWLMWQEKE
ncbi:hypothetical protein JMJ77_0010286, partial [Colletotrichum scovillei]